MCLYPTLILNRKYLPNKKNGWQPPPINDPRTKYVPVGCQNCIECRRQKARAWKVRLLEDIKTNTNGKFVTLTFSNESIKELIKIIRENEKEQSIELEGYALDHEICRVGIRRFLERWRKKHKKSVKHWLVTELGQTSTERIHIHGIIWTENKQDIIDIWKYGRADTGKYVNEASINYIVKYVSKADKLHKEYRPKILTSAGIGKGYIDRRDAKLNKYKNKTDETYKTRTGTKLNLPTYYRNKIYTEEERENLWIKKLDKQERWVDGQKINVKEGDENYYKALYKAREKAKRLGYADDKKNWKKKKYDEMQRQLRRGKNLGKRNK